MTSHDDFDRTLARWFEAEAASPAPADSLQRVVAATRRRLPRPAWLARPGSDWVGEADSLASHLRPFGREADVSAGVISLPQWRHARMPCFRRRARATAARARRAESLVETLVSMLSIHASYHGPGSSVQVARRWLHAQTLPNLRRSSKSARHGTLRPAPLHRKTS